MRRFVLIAAMVAASVSGAGAVTVFESGNKLHEDCSSSRSSFTDGACFGYILGAVDTYEIMRARRDMRPCIRTNANARQVVDVVKKYLRDHPEDRDFTAYTSVEEGLEAAFCPNDPLPVK